ncbi:hypothetical protein Tco_0576435 [Tanacetum coccineum]
MSLTFGIKDALRSKDFECCKILELDQLLVTIRVNRYQESELASGCPFIRLRDRGGVRVAREDDRGVTEGREDVREVFQQCRSRAKRKLSKCGRNQMGNEPILAFPEGPDDFVVYYDARNKFGSRLRKREGDCWLTNRWLSMKKDIASYGSKYLVYSEVEVEYQGSSGLLLQPELLRVEGLTLERCSTFGKKYKLELGYVGPFEILGWIGPIVQLRISVL